jgi:hypothetical protein
MIDPELIKEWYYAAHEEIKAITSAYAKNRCKFEMFESGNHYSTISVTITEPNGLNIVYRESGGSGFWNSVGSANFPATTFLEIMNTINKQIEDRWKSLEEHLERQKKATEDMDTILRKQISSWRLLGKDVKPP